MASLAGIDWNNLESCKKLAKDLGPGMVVVKVKERPNYNITFDVNVSKNLHDKNFEILYCTTPAVFIKRKGKNWVKTSEEFAKSKENDPEWQIKRFL